MYRIGQEEIDALAKVIGSRKLFRYRGPDEGVGECQRFEQRWAAHLGVAHALLTSSGTAALVAALAGLGVGPGDEVIVPAHTFMATAVAVVSVGAIPVIVDIDRSITLCPEAFENAIGPRTRAVIPVHMWGLSCDMDRICRIASKRKLLVVEDACQAVGGAYEGRMCGSIGHAGAFSFNYYKNMTCGEGGAVVTSDDAAAQIMRCAVDCAGFFWNGQETDVRPFCSAGSRSSELEGAVLNVQLDRLESMIQAMRAIKKRVLRRTSGIPGLEPSPANSLDWECGTSILYSLPTAEKAANFAAAVNGSVCGKTGRHTFNEWDPILNRRAGHVPAMNPFTWEANKGCRMNYSPDMCPRSLDILDRTVKIGTNPDWSESQEQACIESIHAAAKPGQ
jgi:dTDP-4-amino-4,6-dideoxygalactose transaminase